jgi:PPOX class probable F420-dependent enzyme
MPADLDQVRQLGGAEHGLVVVSTARPDGTVNTSVVNAGVLSHPVTGEDVVGFVVRGDAHKLQYIRANRRAAVTFRSGWQWVTVEGPADIAGPDDELPGLDPEQIPGLLRDIFKAAGGTHDDWDEYDRVMAEQRRTAVFVEPARIYSN